MTKNEVNKIGKLSYIIQEKISVFLNSKCEFLDNLKIGDILNFSIFQTIFILIYKQSLLNKLNTNNIKQKIICVGNPEPAKHSRIDLYFDRFDNIFSILAKNSDNQFIKNYEHFLDPLSQRKRNLKLKIYQLQK